MPCRIYYQSSWAARILLEARLHNCSSFITLTYSPENLPANNSLSKRDSTLFLKRLRGHFPHLIRYYLCGEYGTQTKRPHYHAALFGYPWTDSKTLKKAWTLGHSQITPLNPARARYLAHYITKKLSGPAKSQDGLENEYSHMSRMPGLGHGYAQKLADTLKQHSLPPTKNTKNTTLSDDNLERLLPNGVPALIRLQKTVYPLHPYLIDRVMEIMGAPSRGTPEWYKFTDSRNNDRGIFVEVLQQLESEQKSQISNLRLTAHL